MAGKIGYAVSFVAFSAAALVAGSVIGYGFCFIYGVAA